MAKQHKIKWRPADEKELRRVVKNYNAKVSRLEKKNPELAHIYPQHTSVKEVKELIATREDFNRELNMLKRFSKSGAEDIVAIPGNDYNLTTTRWQRTEMNRRAAIVNRRRKERRVKLANLEAKSRGEDLGYKLSDIGMGDGWLRALDPVNAFTRRQTRADLDEKWKTLMREGKSEYWSERDFKLRDNYLNEMKKHYPEGMVDDVIEAIEGMDIGDFITTFAEEGYDFDMAYGSDSAEDIGAFADALRATWTPNK